MAALARKLIIFAAVDGLVVQPLSARGQRPSTPVKIRYRDGGVAPASWDVTPDNSRPDSSFEAFGIIGLFTVSRLTFLVSITRRQQVAHFAGSPVYVVTGVAVTPCSSQSEAEAAVASTAAAQRIARIRPPADSEQRSVSSDDDELQVPTPEEVDEVDDAVSSRSPLDATLAGRDDEDTKSSIAQDVIGRKGTYGRFASRWLGRGGRVQDQRRPMGVAVSPGPAETVPPPPPPSKIPLEDEPKKQPTTSSLLPKLLRTAQILFGSSRSFYFSYDHDLTRSLLSADRRRPPAPDVPPLHLRADEDYFWNRHLLGPFTAAGQQAFALPLIQGFVGQKTFAVDRHTAPREDDVDDPVGEAGNPVGETDEPGGHPTPGDASTDLLPAGRRYTAMLVSRRSVRRAGLRYLRRGIDEEGSVANFVETEQILAPHNREDPFSRAYSFVQIRGSIPLFFRQSPYTFKPAPVIQHSPEANLAACRLHFDQLARRYGSVHAVNLVEKGRTEAVVGNAYRQNVERLNEPAAAAARDGGEGPEGARAVPFEWFDFHAVCRGMRFERVSLLLDAVRPVLDAFGSTVEAGGRLLRTQTGVLRTNCMDCLDRTNVCQSSFARHVLEAQLRAEGIDPARQADQHMSWFNELWADNGDAVSKQYVSTAAMKGDYTRTKKRDYRGTLNDLGLSLTRFYNGMVNDYFSQAAIDFLLGNVTQQVFDEFEADMMTKDPAVSALKMREQAIELCQRRVIADESEEFVGGWVLLSPAVPNAIRSAALVEVVLLLTDASLYVCRFDWNLDKVSSFERIALPNLTKIRFGTYVTSAVSGAHLDEAKNVGLVIEYQPGKNDVRRTNTRTASNLERRVGGDGKGDGGAAPEEGVRDVAVSDTGDAKDEPPQPLQRVAFKAPYSTSSLVAADRLKSGGGRVVGQSSVGPTELQLVVTVCAEIDRVAAPWRLDGSGGDEVPGTLVEKDDIVSADDAKKSTGILGTLGHSLKKMVWAS